MERHCSAMAAGRIAWSLAELPCLTVWVSPEQKPTGWLLKSSAFFNHSCLKGKGSACTLCQHQPHMKLLSCASTERCLQRLSLFLRLHCPTRCCRKQTLWAQPLLYTENVLCDNKRCLPPLASISQVFQVYSPVICFHFLMKSL